MKSKKLGSYFTLGEIEDFIEEAKDYCIMNNIFFDKRNIKIQSFTELEYSRNYETGQDTISGVNICFEICYNKFPY